MKQVFKPVLGFEGLYEVSNLGNVFSLPKTWQSGVGTTISHNGKMLKICKREDGKTVVSLFKDKKKKTGNVRKMIFEAFNGKVPNGFDISYKNKDLPHIDFLENLEMTSRSKTCMKRGIRTDNKTGVRGVCWDKQKNKWLAQVGGGVFRSSRGLFDTKEEAISFYESTRKNLYKDRI
jgi:hypothetical protein